MLRENTKKWLREEKALRKPKTPDVRAKEFRIRRTATRAIEDLAFLLEHLDEVELERIFSVENITPFLRALLSLTPEKLKATQERRDWLKSDHFKKRRKRVLGYWRQIFQKGIDVTYGLILVGAESEDVKTYLLAPKLDIKWLQAIYWLSAFKE